MVYTGPLLSLSLQWKCVPLPKLELKDSLLKRTKSLKISNRTAGFTARH